MNRRVQEITDRVEASIHNQLPDLTDEQLERVTALVFSAMNELVQEFRFALIEGGLS